LYFVALLFKTIFVIILNKLCKTSYNKFAFNNIIIHCSMNFKCPFCNRTFAKRSAYAQHVPKCIEKEPVESDCESDGESDNISYDKVYKSIN